jgi:hypothetical protein
VEVSIQAVSPALILSTARRKGSVGVEADAAVELGADESGAAAAAALAAGALAAGTSSAHAPDTVAVNDTAKVNKARQANRAKLVISSIPLFF